MLKVVVGHSNDPDSDSAIAEILEQSDQDLAGNSPQAGILMAAMEFDHALMLKQIHLAYPNIDLIGGTSTGEMSSVLQFQQDSATLMLFCSDEIDIRAGIARNLSQDTIAATASAINQARTDKRPRLCLTLSESIGVNGGAVAQGLQQAVGEGVTVFGGMTGDNNQFQFTYQFFRTEVVQDAAPILLFSGDLLVSCAVATGQFPVSKQGVATKTMEQSILEIDGRPAAEFFFDYFGEIFLGGGGAIGGSLAVFETSGRNFYLRSPSGNDPETGAVHFFGEVPEQPIIKSPR
ncbi:FIST signal transduction protein [Aetokthonos hydrillicola]|uniref:FIST signal transduction protein n=1 Tax=Aetokthonos hydrillicola TaxID=1550245 RepID=UPI001ABB7D93